MHWSLSSVDTASVSVHAHAMKLHAVQWQQFHAKTVSQSKILAITDPHPDYCLHFAHRLAKKTHVRAEQQAFCRSRRLNDVT